MDWNNTLAAAEKITTILVLSLGGIGAYYKFFKGRIFRPRLQLAVGGRVIRNGEVTCLLVITQLKNVGASSIEFSKAGTSIKVYYYGAEFYEPSPHLAVWQPLKRFRIFEDHEWIESGETIKDVLLIPLSRKPEVAFRVDMTVNAHNISFKTRSIVEWETSQGDNKQRKEGSHEPDWNQEPPWPN